MLQFYFIQLILNKHGQIWVHTRWGRVGEKGQSKTMQFDDLDDAKAEFSKKFKDKSGLTWENRLEEPKGGKKYTYLEKNYDDEDEPEVKDEEDDDNNKVKSKLPLASQRLIELIFNENHFNAALEDIGYVSLSCSPGNESLSWYPPGASRNTFTQALYTLKVSN